MGQTSTTVKESVLGLIPTCCRSRRGNNTSQKHIGSRAYGSLRASGSGKYDESDDDHQSLYVNNLLMDDSDEEEQIVIITNPNKKQEETSQRPAQTPPKIDQSVFREGKGLLDLASPARSKAQPQPPQQHNRVKQMEMQMQQDREVNDVMNEIDDQLDDSDGEDTSYLVNANSGTGGADTGTPDRSAEKYNSGFYPEEKQGCQSNDYNTGYDSYAFTDNQNYNATSTTNYDQNYSNQYSSGIPESDYTKYAQPAADDYTNNNYYQSNQGNWDQQWQENSNQADDIMAELDQAAGSDDEILL